MIFRVGPGIDLTTVSYIMAGPFISALNMLNSPIATMAFVFGSMQLLRFVDMTDKKVIVVLRTAYITSQILMLLVWVMLRSKIVEKAKIYRKKGTKNVKKTDETLPKEEMVEIEEPVPPFSGEAPKKKLISVSEYDVSECGKQIQQIIVGSIIMMVLHFWMGLVQPLFLQALLPWKSLLTQPLFMIHYLGCEAAGSLQRPFKQPNPFGDMMANAAQSSPEQPASIKSFVEEVNSESETSDSDNLSEESTNKMDDINAESKNRSQDVSLKNRKKN